MIVHDWTVKICRQTLNNKPSAKDKPYIYSAEEPEFMKLSTDELNKIYLDSQSIMARIQSMLVQRG